MQAKDSKVFNAEQQQEILLLIEQRVSLREIARGFGRDVKTVMRIAKAHNAQPNARGFRLTPEQTDEAIRRYNNGEGFQMIAKDLHVWSPNLRRVLVEHGIDIRPSSTPPHIEDAIAHDFVHGGLNIHAMMRKHRVTAKVIYRITEERKLVRETPAYIPRVPRKGSNHSIWLKEYGKEEADRRDALYRQGCSERSKGSNNAMYGRPAPQGSGNGWKGWYKGIFFRSLRELAFMIELEEQNVQWVNGEKKEYRVKYIDYEGTERTYCPDFVVLGKAMYEVKPKRLWNSPLVTAKRLAAEEMCKRLNIEYHLVDPELCEDKLMEVYETGNIKWLGKCEEKFLAYYKVKN